MKKKIFTFFLALVAGTGTMFAWDYMHVQNGDLYYNLDATNQAAEVTSQNSSYPYWSATIATANIPSSVEYNSVTYTVTSIGNNAFYGCSGLTSLTCEATTPPTLGGGVFSGVEKSIPLYVPAESVEAYQSAEQWSEFTNILPIPGTEVPCEEVRTIFENSTCYGYYFHNQWLNESGVYRDTLVSRTTGCDSIVELHLTVNPYYHVYADTLFIERGDSIILGRGMPWQRTVFPLRSRSYLDTLYTIHGCDSLVTRMVIVTTPCQPYYFYDSLTLCAGETYEWQHQTIRYSGRDSSYYVGNGWRYKQLEDARTYTASYMSREGCDSIYKLFVHYLPTYHTYYSDSMELGEVHPRFGVITDNIHYTDSFQNHFGCDSIVTWIIHLKYYPEYTVSLSVNNTGYGLVRGGWWYPQTDTSFSVQYLDTITIQAIPFEGYRFVSWSDGSTVNPRNIRVTQDIAFTAYFEPAACISASGYCGENATWTLSCDSVMTIAGSGDMNWSAAYYNHGGDNWFFDYSYNCRKVIISEGVTSVGDSAFLSRSGVQTVEMANTVSHIGNSAFARCRGLSTVTIPGSVTIIGHASFEYCTGLTSITCEAMTPPTLDSDVFYGIDKSIPLFVPEEAVVAYQATDQWNEFYNILPIGGSVPEEPRYPIFVHLYDSIYSSTIETAMIYQDTALFYDYNSGKYVVYADQMARNQWLLTARTTPRYYVRYWLTPDYVPASDSLFLTLHDTTDVTLVVSPRSYSIHLYSNNSEQGSIRADYWYPQTDTIYYARYADSTTIEAIPQEGYQFVRWSDGNAKNPRNLSVAKDTELAAVFEPVLTGRRVYNFAGIKVEDITTDGTFGTSYLTETYGCPNISVDANVDANVTIRNMSNFVFNYKNTGGKGGILIFGDGFVQANGKNVIFTFTDVTIGDTIKLWVSAKNSTDATFTALNGAEESIQSVTRINNLEDYAIVSFVATSDVVQIKETTSGFRVRRAIIGEGSSETPETPVVDTPTIVLPDVTVQIPYAESFLGSVGQFSILDINKDTLPYIWQETDKYGMKGSGYAKGPHTVESWLVSPNIVLPDVPNLELSFETAINYASPDYDATSVKISTDNGATWTDMQCSNWPIENNWIFKSIVESLDAYAGQNIRIAFVYSSLAEYANPTWEVRNLVVREKISQDTCLIASGTCGENLTWELGCDSVLTISGTGQMDTVLSLRNYKDVIKSVVINESATSIGYGAFVEFINMISISIPNTITSIDYAALNYCSSLSSVEIPNSVVSIGDYAFAYSGLTSITIPNSVLSIGELVFFDCYSLTSIHVDDQNPNYSSLGGVLFNKDKTALIQCPSGKQGEYVIPNSVTAIGAWAFFDCYALSSVTIPNSVTNIGDYAFVVESVRSGLTSMICEAIVPPTLEGDVFYGIDKSIPLYVPVESIEAYQSADGWNQFTNILPIQAQGPISITCAEAVSYMPAENGTMTETAYTVVGYVTSTNGSVSPSNENASIYRQTFYMDDVKGTAKTLQGYYCNLPGHEPLNVGDKITVTGKITNYRGQAEIKNGDVVILERVQVAIDTTDATVCEALEVGATLGAGDYSTDVFRVYGRVKGTDQASSGAHTFDMACGESTFKAYRCINTAAAFDTRDSVVVIGKLYNYNGTIEISGGFVELIEKAPKIITTQPNNPGYGYTTPSDTIVQKGDSIRIQAIPYEGYQFVSWSDGSTANPRILAVRQDASYTAIFIPVVVNEAKMWPIILDDYTAQNNQQYIVGDFRKNDVDNFLYIWENTYYNTVPTGLNYYQNGSEYLSLEVGSQGWSGLGVTLTNTTSLAMAQMLIDSIVDHPEDYYLHLAIKSNDQASHGFYVFGNEGTSFTLGTSTIQTYPVIGDFARDGEWHDMYIPLSSYAAHIAMTNIPAYGLNIFCALSGNAAGAELNLDAVYFCNRAYMNLGSTEPDRYEVTTQPNIPEYGYTIPSDTTVNKGDTIFIEAIPYEGYRFVGWTDGSMENPRAIRVARNMNFTAYFLPNCEETKTIRELNVCGGYYFGYQWLEQSGLYRDTLVTRTGCDSIVEIYLTVYPYYHTHDSIFLEQGDSIIVAAGLPWQQTIYPTSDFSFNDTLFSINGCDSMITYHVFVTMPPQYTITLAVNNTKYGSVDGAGTFTKDTIVQIWATPNKGYQFNQWSDGSTENPRRIRVTQDTTFTAVFGTKICSWEVESNDIDMGVVITTFNEPFYNYGTQITVEASPNSGYKFVKWNDGKKYNPYKFSIKDDKYLMAIFMAAEEEQDTTTVQPTASTATFTWPFIEGGYTYSLTIYLDAACTIPFCTLTFNQYGQLVAIHFGSMAPRRTIPQEEGFTYTISGLDANTEYYFKMETKNEENKLINTDEGTFTTTNETPTGVEDVQSATPKAIKFIMNGQIYILRGDKIYTLTGQEVK